MTENTPSQKPQFNGYELHPSAVSLDDGTLLKIFEANGGFAFGRGDVLFVRAITPSEEQDPKKSLFYILPLYNQCEVIVPSLETDAVCREPFGPEICHCKFDAMTGELREIDLPAEGDFDATIIDLDPEYPHVQYYHNGFPRSKRFVYDSGKKYPFIKTSSGPQNILLKEFKNANRARLTVEYTCVNGIPRQKTVTTLPLSLGANLLNRLGSCADQDWVASDLTNDINSITYRRQIVGSDRRAAA